MRTVTVGVAALAVGLTMLGGSASAATFPVTDEASFEAAVASANSAGGANTIDVSPGQYNPTHTITLANGVLTIQGPTTPNASTTAAPAQFTGGALVTPQPGASVFAVSANETVNFNDVQIASSGSPGNGSIDVSGTVNVTQSMINPTGPGLTVEHGGTATVVDSTISDGLDFGIINLGTATLTNTTVARNMNGGIDNANGTALNLINSAVAQNGSPDCTASATTADHSLDGDGTCGVGTLSGKAAMLGSLALHGGTSATDIPKAGSPLIGAGDPAAGRCPAVDQRNAASPSVAGNACDIGAVETYYGVKPVLTTANVKVGSPSASGTVATYTPTWNAGSPVTSVSCSPPSGSTFKPGQTTVTCTGTDSLFGATGSGTFTVTDVKSTPPVVTTSGDQTIAATDAGGAVATFTASATDSTDGSDTPTCTPASGSKFPVGATTVTCSATDSVGLTGTATLTITVNPFVAPPPPMITVPANITMNATSRSGAVASFTASAADPAGGTDPVVCTPASGSTFPIGATTVTCSATDRAGVTASASFTVTVQPGAPPVVTVPSDMSAAATMPGGAQVTYTASATDPVDGTIPVTCTPASGSTFSIGKTKVNCSATDKAGNTASNAFNVTVTQSLPPVIVVPANISVAATSTAGAKVSFTVNVTDPVDGALTPTCTPASGATFPVGTTTVTCTATNKAAIAAAAQSFTVTVKTFAPPLAPVITVPPFRTLGAESAAGLAVTYVVTATDKVDGTVPVTCTPASGSTFRVGTTTVTCTATDSGGRSASASFQIAVTPPDQPAVASVKSAHVKKKLATVVIACVGSSGDTCTVAVEFELSSAASAKAAKLRSRLLSKRTETLAAGDRKTLHFRLSGGAAALLTKRHRLVAAVRLVQAGQKSHSSQLVFKA